MNYLNGIINEVLPKPGRTQSKQYEKLKQASLPILWRENGEYPRILVCIGKFNQGNGAEGNMKIVMWRCIT
jgi:hypothetical protein